MNSVEIAEKKIAENLETIEELRRQETGLMKLIADNEAVIEEYQRYVEIYQKDIEKLRDEKRELLVVNQALAAFVDNGGGLDMLEEELPKKSGSFKWGE